MSRAGTNPPSAHVSVTSKTWARDSHELFDFEASELNRQPFEVTSSSTCVRNGTEVSMVPDGGTISRECDSLLRLVQKDSAFWVDKAPSSNNSKKLWIVVKDLPESCHRLVEGDVMKLGRFKFKVRQLVAQSTNGQQPELRLSNTVCAFSSAMHGVFDESGVACSNQGEGMPDLSTVSCRICLLEGPGEDDPFITPCQCRGSIEYVHLACLRHWIRGRLNLSDGPTGSYFYRPLACELCKAVYPTYVHLGPDQPPQPLVEVPHTQAPFIVLENIVRDSQQHAAKGLHVISLAEKVLKLGRGHESDVRIADVSISRCHATIRFSRGSFMLEDNDSKFGTLVQMKKPKLLEPGVPISIQMGRTVLNLQAQSAASGLSQLPDSNVQDERALRLSLLNRGNSQHTVGGGTESWRTDTDLLGQNIVPIPGAAVIPVEDPEDN
mmetsp:Transcript_45555/g.97698  ORF Transcript_45555/g.97698 Transcript_45555/m.97698 type:complete len:437 (+) Transcript_45555:198-1508(+)|eukprot:CAMPEP_0206470358 /NCGR_PEP_ID=MMETSP0324_2-20121206/30881_1 /ASSEMBLY_ACC=CAM_ASM_000836 /TAXON_ID=2866 /ORGANISM="Crypthecodinium cohnii, Strain Seligo" /LENGTH=436 /DNA_ID=CAMNT_0053944399 /DNA_START=97 /DNA_END=1407 /DNA_ORIENTATION=-